MAKVKLYFKDKDSEYCQSLDSFKDEMRLNGIQEMTVIEAVKDNSKDYFYCQSAGEVTENDGICGKGCCDYEPRNGKNGICNHKSPCYFPDGKAITIKLNT
jgi:hypothetical protein